MDNCAFSPLDFRRLDDSKAVSQFYDVLSDASIYQYIPAPPPQDDNEFVARHMPTPSKIVYGAYALTPSAAPVGLLEIRLDEPETASVGYLVGVAYWGKGFASAMICRATQEARIIGVRKLFAMVDSRNVGSIKALERNAFIRDGERHAMLKREASTDIVLCRTM